jgi:hypothetical protein
LQQVEQLITMMESNPAMAEMMQQMFSVRRDLRPKKSSLALANTDRLSAAESSAR